MQDALNHYLYHPLAWQLALRLARTPLTPNMVSVIGACFVMAAAVAYAQPPWLPLWLTAWPISALLGMGLHMTWHVVDGADGDLARITGRSSPIGEMVDGICDYFSHIVLYVVLGFLLDAQIGHIAWLITAIAGASHIVQANHVEVQRRQYQWWVYGVPWLRNTQQDTAATARGGFGALVSAYLQLASGMTPHALRVDAAVAAAAHDGAATERIRAAVRTEVIPLLPLCKLLGPNPRAIVLGLSMLVGSPLYYFIYQSLALNLLLVLSVARHNQAAQRIAARVAA
jgi:phosphatidylglycerophosphate synthase